MCSISCKPVRYAIILKCMCMYVCSESNLDVHEHTHSQKGPHSLTKRSTDNTGGFFVALWLIIRTNFDLLNPLCMHSYSRLHRQHRGFLRCNPAQKSHVATEFTPLQRPLFAQSQSEHHTNQGRAAAEISIQEPTSLPHCRSTCCCHGEETGQCPGRTQSKQPVFCLPQGALRNESSRRRR